MSLKNIKYSNYKLVLVLSKVLAYHIVTDRDVNITEAYILFLYQCQRKPLPSLGIKHGTSQLKDERASV